LRGIHPDALSNRAGRTALNLPIAILEPMARAGSERTLGKIHNIGIAL
jgi:hypothetical protein